MQCPYCRFGTGSTLHGSDSEAFKKSEDLKRKARAERFPFMRFNSLFIYIILEFPENL